MVVSENTIYYTLSTIAQSEAALMAVMITIIFFILQSLENKLRENLIARADQQTRANALEDVLRLIYSKQFEEANNSFMANHPMDLAIKQWLIQKKKLERVLFAPLFFGLITIMLSIFGLMLTDVLAETVLGIYVISGISLIFFTSIFLIFRDIGAFISNK